MHTYAHSCTLMHTHAHSCILMRHTHAHSCTLMHTHAHSYPLIPTHAHRRSVGLTPSPSLWALSEVAHNKYIKSTYNGNKFACRPHIWTCTMTNPQSFHNHQKHICKLKFETWTLTHDDTQRKRLSEWDFMQWSQSSLSARPRQFTVVQLQLQLQLQFNDLTSTIHVTPGAVTMSQNTLRHSTMIIMSHSNHES